MCDVVMVCDNIARQIPVDKYDCYPGIEQDEDDDDIDALAQSFDLNSGKNCFERNFCTLNIVGFTLVMLLLLILFYIQNVRRSTVWFKASPI